MVVVIMEKVLDLLSKLKIEYGFLEHKPVYTVEEARDIDALIEGTGCKNLFLKDKSNHYFLYVLNCEKRADLKKLQKDIECGRLNFASEDDLYKYLKLTRGSVSPLGIINDEECDVTVVLDNELKEKRLLMHPNINTATVSIEYDDIIKFIQFCRNKYIEV